MSAKHYSSYELSKDERALIYQHVLELQNEFPGFGPVTVSVLKRQVENQPEQYTLTLSTQDGLNLETEGIGASIYEASFQAKEVLMAKLRLLASSVQNSPERALQIISILHGNTLH
jgi:hypothetical protein